MNIEALNSRYGAPGRIVFHNGFAGYPNVVLANKYGSAEVALLGANVLSYRPTGHSQVLFRPAKRDDEYNRGNGFHGGIPVCFPQFGNRLDPKLPQHGFVRKLIFEPVGSEYSEEMTELTLAVRSDEETRKLWPHDFLLEIKITLSMKLNLTMTVKNTSSEPFVFSGGFHPYFLLRDRDLVTVRGLDNHAYIDGTTEPMTEGVQRGDIELTRGYDHIFDSGNALKNEYAIIDPGLKRAIAVVSTGNARAIVWNPDNAYVVEDHTPENFHRFVCVEPVSDWPGGRTLESGATYELVAAIQSTMRVENCEV